MRTNPNEPLPGIFETTSILSTTTTSPAISTTTTSTTTSTTTTTTTSCTCNQAQIENPNNAVAAVTPNQATPDQSSYTCGTFVIYNCTSPDTRTPCYTRTNSENACLTLIQGRYV
uniref:Uncharacterized protein n=1 Tax=Acrobeloides nanus TaxID=290746 RepID=A0A914CD82_9BILA